MIQSILIPLYDSNTNKDVLRFAALMALRMQKAIHLLKVVSPNQAKDSPTSQAAQVPTASSKNTHDYFHAGQSSIEKLTEELKVLTFNSVPINYFISYREVAPKAWQYSPQTTEALLMIGLENFRHDLAAFFADADRPFWRSQNVPMIVLPEGTKFRNINRIIYVVEDLKDIQSGFKMIQLLAANPQAKIYMILSYNSIQNLRAWDRKKQKASILAGIHYPNVDLEIRAEKDLYRIALSQVNPQLADLIALHHKSLKPVIESAPQISLKTDLPLLLLPDRE